MLAGAPGPAWLRSSFGSMSAPPQSEGLEQSRPVSRMHLSLVYGCKVFGVLFVIVMSLAGVWWLVKQKAAHERAQWKGPALERLVALSATNEAIHRELDELKAGPTADIHRGWTGDSVLLMTNGEYIIYAFRHGANSGFVDHLFLGHSSDGRWLYSTYHFCNHMAGADADPPGSINEFATTYSAHEFDGKSDECLKHTWPLKK